MYAKIQNMRKPAITYDTVRRMALAMPSVEEGTSYGTAALKVRGKLFVRLREDGESAVFMMPFDRREELMAAQPEIYYITDHYRDYPAVLARLSKVPTDALPGLLRMAHAAAMPKRAIKKSR
jgi:hypothetical protein